MDVPRTSSLGRLHLQLVVAGVAFACMVIPRSGRCVPPPDAGAKTRPPAGASAAQPSARRQHDSQPMPGELSETPPSAADEGEKGTGSSVLAHEDSPPHDKTKTSDETAQQSSTPGWILLLIGACAALTIIVAVFLAKKVEDLENEVYELRTAARDRPQGKVVTAGVGSKPIPDPRVGELEEQVRAISTHLKSQLTLDGVPAALENAMNAVEEEHRQRASRVKRADGTALGSGLSLAVRLYQSQCWTHDDYWYSMKRMLGPQHDLISSQAPKRPEALARTPRTVAEAIELTLMAGAFCEQVRKDAERIERAVRDPFEPDRAQLLDALSDVLGRLDETGTGSPREDLADAWRDTFAFARQVGLELVYPKVGTPLSQAEHELASVERNTRLPEHSIVRVVSFGYRPAGGQVGRKARVVVAG